MPPRARKPEPKEPTPKRKAVKTSYGVTFVERISESALSVTIGERLRRREGPMPNIRGDRPPEHTSDLA